MRLRAEKARRHGEPETSLIAAMGVKIRTVFRWLLTCTSGGISALLPKLIQGRNVATGYCSRGKLSHVGLPCVHGRIQGTPGLDHVYR